jgi:hypothetical protein
MRLSKAFSFATLTLVSVAAACGSDKENIDAPNVPTPAAVAAPAVACEKASLSDIAAAGLTSTPNACSGQMYEKYTHTGFQSVNNNIAQIALAAPTDKLGDTFQTKIAQASTARQTQFTENLLTFLETAFGRTDIAYTGPGMVPAHANLGITIAQYKYFITDVVVPALKKAGVDESDISNCFAPAVFNTDFVATVVTCK